MTGETNNPIATAIVEAEKFQGSIVDTAQSRKRAMPKSW